MAEEYLLEGENILAECKVKDWVFYATDKRILKYGKGGLFQKEALNDISYAELSSLSLVTKRGLGGVVVLGVFLFILALIGLYLRLLTELMMLLAFVGLVVIIAGLLYERSWFQFKGPGLLMNKEEQKVWRLEETKKVDVRDFMKKLREQLAKRGV